jgi:hypothetical protein
MYEKHFECERFDQWLLEGATELESPVWREHLRTCDECTEQWHAHQILALTFVEEPVPELSADFEAELDLRIASAIEIHPLSGWKKVAMFGYGAAGLGALAWLLKDVPLPTIDLSSPWVPIAALVAVPLTFMLAIAASRLIPGRGLPRGMRMFSL